MNKYKLISMAAAALIIVAGFIYLSVGSASLIAVLALCAVSICIMGGVSVCETRASGQKGVVSYISALCFFVLAAFICAAIVFLLM